MKWLIIVGLTIIIIGLIWLNAPERPAIPKPRPYPAPRIPMTDSENLCDPLSILAAENPDARWSHCHDRDWDGSTFLKDRLSEMNDKTDEYKTLCQSDQLQRVEIQTEPMLEESLRKQQ